MRIIDADAVKELIRSGISVDTCADQDYVCELVDDIPTIDSVEVVHGEWIGYNADKGSDWLRSDGEPIFLVCNKCHGVVMNHASVNWNFCPNCGAKMDGERKEGE